VSKRTPEAARVRAIELLEQARQTLRDKALPETLTHLLAAWRDHRAAEIAEVIEHVGALCRPEPILVKSNQSQQAAWLARASAQAPEDCELLLGSLEQNKAHALGRLVALAEWAPDPRVARFLCNLLATKRLAANSGRGYLLQGAPILKRVGDPRSAAWMRAISERQARKAPREVLADVMDRLPVAPAPDDAISELCKALLGAAETYRPPTPEGDPEQGEELLDAVYDDPDDIGRLLVYADWLLQRGDPRGEFIALQCRSAEPGAKRTSRERALEKTHGRDWVPRGAAVLKRGTVFQRGFVTEMAIKNPPRHGVPSSWSTLRGLDVWAAYGTIANMLDAFPLRHLRALRGLSQHDLVVLVNAQPELQIEEITGFNNGNLHHVMQLLEQWTPWTALRHLGLQHLQGIPGHARLRRLLESKSMERVETLTFPIGEFDELSVFHATLAESAPPRLLRLTLMRGRYVEPGYAKGAVVTFARGPEGTFSRAEVRVDHKVWTNPAEDATAAVEQLPPEAIRHLEVAMGKRYWKQTLAVAHLERLARERFAAELVATKL